MFYVIFALLKIPFQPKPHVSSSLERRVVHASELVENFEISIPLLHGLRQSFEGHASVDRLPGYRNQAGFRGKTMAPIDIYLLRLKPYKVIRMCLSMD